MVCSTWNASKASFNDPNKVFFEGRSTADVLSQITCSYRFYVADIVENYNCFNIFKDGDIAGDLENYPKDLKQFFEH